MGASQKRTALRWLSFRVDSSINMNVYHLAEAGWTRMENRNWESFRERLLPNLSDLMRRGVSVRVPFEIFDREQ